jgi:hypothetical protein
MTPNDVKGELGPHFSNATEIHVLTLPELTYLTISASGVAAVHIDNLQANSFFNSGNIRFFLRKQGDNAIPFSYKSAGLIESGNYAFVKPNDHASRSPKPTIDHSYLLFHLEDNGNYLHSISSGYFASTTPKVYPVFAKGTGGGSDDGGSGGCNAGAAPLALLLLAGAGAAIKVFKKSGD